MYELKVETAQDVHEVEALFDLCFAPGREALSSYRLRDDVAPVASLNQVARDVDGILAGAIRYWPVLAGGAVSLLLGPIAVHPTRQGEGLAGELIRSSLALAARDGWARVMLVGDAPYYARFGFEKLSGVVMPPPTNPDRVLGQPLVPGAWKGIAGTVQRYPHDGSGPD
ncbi:N-acetyltransferase [uncultured Roseobacter sp.]|uniref:GNAT family N-acetyltransferase n=1 Tax=uncultured Roseobacter sp. TaxID=114847 RepID=UPI002611FEF5|nr:N-acetyltransferase [uncultured Roseobacter sp.]